MRNLIRLNEYTIQDVEFIFKIADELQNGKYENFLRNKTFVMFFPQTSIRTRITFEKGIYLLGGQTILFPPETLDKKEAIEDVIGYLNNWADGLIVRHQKIEMLDKMSEYAKFPIINAMTDSNHPCEMLADLYALSKLRSDYKKDKFLFVGADGNIGRAWREAAGLLGLSLTQSCPKSYAMEGVEQVASLEEAIIGKDIICTDSLSYDKGKDFKEHQITVELMRKANPKALLNPCPPFYRGEEVSADVIESSFFAGHSFKKNLLEIQQAIIIYCLL